LATEILTESVASIVKFFDSPQKLFCCQCGVNAILRPECATSLTRYTCPRCCDLLLKNRDRETADTLSAIGAQIDAARVRESGCSDHFGAQP
jgi:hypothetical protein